MVQASTEKAPAVHQGGDAIKKEVDFASLKPVDAPYFSAGSFAIQGTGNDFILMFSRAIPVQSVTTGVNSEIALAQVVAILSISPQTAKDISLAMADAVVKHEKEYGEIITPYTKRLAASVGQKQGH